MYVRESSSDGAEDTCSYGCVRSPAFLPPVWRGVLCVLLLAAAQLMTEVEKGDIYHDVEEGQGPEPNSFCRTLRQNPNKK